MLHVLTRLILTATLGGGDRYNLHFTDEETWGQKHEVHFARLPTWPGTESGLPSLAPGPICTSSRSGQEDGCPANVCLV